MCNKSCKLLALQQEMEVVNSKVQGNQLPVESAAFMFVARFVKVARREA